MSGIVLTAAVRQNLLSLQSTAALLATTQNNLATGNKVNSALDNPTEFFTAQGLNNRASDISNLLDGISNGVQILQAANTGLTSLEQLVSNAQSIASQVLQSPTGYDTKSNVTSTAILGATANNLLGNNINATVTGGTVAGLTGATLLTSLSGGGLTNGTDLVVDGPHTISFSTSQTTVTNDGLGDFVIGIGTGSQLKVSDVLNAIDSITGTPVASTVTGNALVLSTGITSTLQVSGNALAAFGFAANVSQNFTPPALNGETLTVTATPPGTGGGIPTNITFGTGAGQVSTLAQLNAALAPNNLQAIIASSGAITISTTNDAASTTIGTIGGTAAAAGQPFNGLVPGAPVPNANSQSARANLVTQYNNVLAQINTTAQDASFNGINLLGGDTLKLVFDETGKSTLNIQGVTFSAVGLGLSNLFVGADFLDSNSANRVLGVLSSAQTTLRSEASTLGSNLSIVQIREDFNKNLINVLQTGASNLTLADNNQEAANSQALSTRQSIAVSALALANQSQASVLQLLR